MRGVIVIIDSDITLAATLKILAALAVIWLVCWGACRLLDELEHRANMRRTLDRALARRPGRGRPTRRPRVPRPRRGSLCR
jgi:hypothetical protein